MKVLECKHIDIENYSQIIFIRIEPENLVITIQDIITLFFDLSWISKFDQPYVRNSFQKRAEDSAKYLAEKMGTHKDDEITKDTGEYAVSELARQTLVQHCINNGGLNHQRYPCICSFEWMRCEIILFYKTENTFFKLLQNLYYMRSIQTLEESTPIFRYRFFISALYGTWIKSNLFSSSSRHRKA